MELNQRIAFVRRAAGLSQEQLGERLGVTRQAVSKWESGQTVPDAITISRLCQVLNVSADFVLLGKEPEEGAHTSQEDAHASQESTHASQEDPLVCPCCGRRSPAATTVNCPGCGYDFFPRRPDDDKRYAILLTSANLTDDGRDDLVTYAGLSPDAAKQMVDQLHASKTMDPIFLRRGLPASAALWMASHLVRNLSVRIVADDPAFTDEELCAFPTAMEPPQEAPPPQWVEEAKGLGFGGTVAAVIVGIIGAVLILSLL